MIVPFWEILEASKRAFRSEGEYIEYILWHPDHTVIIKVKLYQ